MSIERNCATEHGQLFTVCCDSCYDVHEIEDDSIEAANAQLEEGGWVVSKPDKTRFKGDTSMAYTEEYYNHTCPDCA